MNTNQKLAVERMRTVDTSMWNEGNLGHAMTCTEAEGLMRLFEAFGLDSHCEALRTDHAAADEAYGDDHQEAIA